MKTVQQALKSVHVHRIAEKFKYFIHEIFDFQKGTQYQMLSCHCASIKWQLKKKA